VGGGTGEADVRRLIYRVGEGSLLSIPLSVDPDIIRHRVGEQRQITLSVNDSKTSCRTSYSALVA